MKVWDGKFPFTDAGELLAYETAWTGERGATRKTADEARFTGTLRYAGFQRGRSAAHLLFTDGSKVNRYQHQPEVEDDRDFVVFLTDAEPIIRAMVKGEIEGSFVPVKRGCNYGWKMEVAKPKRGHRG